MQRLCGLHISHSRFITDMRRAQFADSLVEASDFSYADLRDTLWQRARIRRCYFREARFSDAAFDDTMFIDCDMRGVDFSMDGVDLSTAPGATFVRCDLRGAGWGGRDHGIRDARVPSLRYGRPCWPDRTDGWARPVAKLRGGGELRAPDPAALYTPGEHGHVDWPVA